MSTTPSQSSDGGFRVLVLGTGRCGTSLAARVIHDLGLPVSTDVSDHPQAGNEKGYWESPSLVQLNDELLDVLGGTNVAPPRLPSGWQDDDEIVARRADAARMFTDVYPTSNWVWKDPRNCSLLPFWLRALPPVSAIVVMTRNLLETTSSMVNVGLTKRHALALWERRSREMLTHLTGLSVLFADYADALSDPMHWRAEVVAFFEACGMHPVGREGLPQESVDASLRHSRYTSIEVAEDDDVSESQRALDTLIGTLKGPHMRFAGTSMPLETAWTESVLAEHRSGYIRDMGRSLRWFTHHYASMQGDAQGGR